MALVRSRVSFLATPQLERVHHLSHFQEWAPHWHEHWSFGAVLRGACHCSIAGQPVVCEAGDLIAIAPGVIHTGAIMPNPLAECASIVMLYVEQTWLDQRQLRPLRSLVSPQFPELAASAECLQSASELDAWLREVLPRLSTASSRIVVAPTTAQLPAQTRQLLLNIQAAVLSGVHRVSDLASQCGISREHIHRLFKTHLGQSPSDYLRMVRLHRARQLVLEQADGASVAAACGFADQAHFVRWFRRCFGYTPGDLLKARMTANPV